MLLQQQGLWGKQLDLRRRVRERTLLSACATSQGCHYVRKRGRGFAFFSLEASLFIQHLPMQIERRSSLYIQGYIKEFFFTENERNFDVYLYISFSRVISIIIISSVYSSCSLRHGNIGRIYSSSDMCVR
jgi:hypothetical protein